jgi:hypothetical protein
MRPVIEAERQATGENLINYIANRMMIVLASPEETIIKEGDTLESKILYSMIIY